MVLQSSSSMPTEGSSAATNDSLLVFALSLNAFQGETQAGIFLPNPGDRASEAIDLVQSFLF